MKITLLTPALAAILGLALVSAPVTTHAQTTTTTATAAAPAPAPAPAAKKAKATKPTPYSGSLTAIDATANTVTVESTTKAGVKTLTLAITPATKFLNAGKTATLADFAVGDAVTGSYDKNADGSLAAHSLHKGMSKAKTPKTPKAPKTPAATAPAATTAPAPAAPAAQ